MQKEDIAIGIDPGATGGSVAIVQKIGKVQVEKIIGTPTEGIIYAKETGAKVFLEKVHAFPGQGATGTFNFGMSYGLVFGAAEVLGVSLTLVSPQRWQAAILERPEGRGTKEAALRFVEREWGLDGFTVGRARKPHSGLIDAACIAYWGLLYGDGYVEPAKVKKRKAIVF